MPIQKVHNSSIKHCRIRRKIYPMPRPWMQIRLHLRSRESLILQSILESRDATSAARKQIIFAGCKKHASVVCGGFKVHSACGQCFDNGGGLRDGLCVFDSGDLVGFVEKGLGVGVDVAEAEVGRVTSPGRALCRGELSVEEGRD